MLCHARLIKLFHAGLASPKLLKSMLGVGPLGASLNIMPSGGVSPANAAEWLAAGAVVVGMGSNLVGSDVNAQVGTPAYHDAVAQWREVGEPAARRLFEEVAAK